MSDRRPDGIDAAPPTSGTTFPTKVDAWLLLGGAGAVPAAREGQRWARSVRARLAEGARAVHRGVGEAGAGSEPGVKPSSRALFFDPDDLVATLVGLVVGWGLSAVVSSKSP